MKKWLTIGLVIGLVCLALLGIGAKGCGGGGHHTTGSSGSSGNIWIAMTTTDVPTAREYHTAVWTGTEMLIWGGADASADRLNSGAKYYPITDTWVSITDTDAPVSKVSHTAIWTGQEMIVWGGEDGITHLNTGAKYYPITDTWVSITTTDAPISRHLHTAVWTGNEIIVWGGDDGIDYFNDGAKYYPITDTWVSISTTDAPVSRSYHTAIWTGQEMIIWGGTDDGSGNGVLNTGAKYYPITDTWVSITTTDAPVSRMEHTAVWTGTEMLIWGGYDSSNFYQTSAKYNPSTDTWTPITTADASLRRYEHTAIWTGTKMIIWGGRTPNPIAGTHLVNTGSKYNPINNTWTDITTTGAPLLRELHTAVWTGIEMLIWGGSPFPQSTSGGRYKP